MLFPHIIEQGFLASLRSALFTKKPAPVVNAAVLPVYDSILDPAPALPPPRVDELSLEKERKLSEILNISFLVLLLLCTPCLLACRCC